MISKERLREIAKGFEFGEVEIKNQQGRTIYTHSKPKQNSPEYATHLLDMELDKNADDISLKRIENLINEGADLEYRNHMGYSFGERAGFKLRLDVVARINELRSGWA